MGLQNYVIATRFMTTICHFTALIMVWELKQATIEVHLGDTYSKERKDSIEMEIDSALAFGLLCFLWDFASIIFGNSLFIDASNYFQILCHFVGGLLLSWFVLKRWHQSILWPIILSTNFLTAMSEILVNIGLFRLKSFA